MRELAGSLGGSLGDSLGGSLGDSLGVNRRTVESACTGPDGEDAETMPRASRFWP